MFEGKMWGLLGGEGLFKQADSAPGTERAARPADHLAGVADTVQRHDAGTEHQIAAQAKHRLPAAVDAFGLLQPQRLVFGQIQALLLDLANQPLFFPFR